MAVEEKPPATGADDHEAQDAADDLEIARMLEPGAENPFNNFDHDKEIDQTGKADDAEDFEDISDDDLPDEEPSASASLEMPALTDDGGSNDADDLFGEGPSSPMELPTAASPAPHVRDAEIPDENQTQIDTGLSFASINFDPEPQGGANQDANIPDAVERDEDLLKAAWPAYKKGKVLKWSALLPNKKATWKEKRPGRKPRQLIMSKLSLELAADQEKQFRIPGTAVASQRERYTIAQSHGLVICDIDLEKKAQEMPQFDLDQDSDLEPVGGFTLRDIEMACIDYAAQIEHVQEDFEKAQAAELEAQKRKPANADHDDEWDAEFLMDIDDAPARPQKRPRVVKPGLPSIPRYTAPSFDNFEEATKRGAKRVHLETDDPYLLLEDQESQHKKRRRDVSEAGHKPSGRASAIPGRFNLSNDKAYELLKENHQSKVRATLGNISVEHGMPALKLTWPYYQVKLRGTTDEYHRPKFRTRKFTGIPIRFEKPAHHKRKLMKGKAQDVYRGSKDLSISDNGAAVLFEYCEPRPRVLNGFAMGNKIINYYRRKDATEDDVLEKRELGEYRTLLPEDRSPFSIFGKVEAGETVPTLHNEMYRAPVFRHTPRSTDFLMVRNTTGMEGSKWYLHKIDHLHVVGQQFPSVEVPGPHSRKVTNASKNRMKMLAFRLIRHSPHNNASLSEITRHIADSTDTQNRQKLKEFLQYDRESQEKGTWKLRAGETLLDEAGIRAMIRPEDVQLLDAMQLGMKELEDAGYDPRNANIDDDVQNAAGEEDEEDGDEEGSKAPKNTKKTVEAKEETLADKLAPWKTTKAFIDATQHKAMLQLHGDGDPTGHGLGFSFIRTSMKGGYIEAVQGPLATSADAMEREKRANGGHAYNVKKQQQMYEEGINEIWEKQKSTLSDPQEHDDKDVAVTEDEDDRFNMQLAATPAQFDEGTSQISGLTSSSRHPKRAIRIVREVTMPDGSTQQRHEVVHDPVVITQYMKRRTEAELENRDLYSSLPTGNADHDRLANLRIKQELDRLKKNQARRLAREQQKELQNRAASGTAGSPAAGTPGLDKIPGGTTRKCANCGQWKSELFKAHIKDVGGNPDNTRRRKDPNMKFVKVLADRDKRRRAEEKKAAAAQNKHREQTEREAAKREADETKRLAKEQRDARKAAAVEAKRLQQEEEKRQKQAARDASVLAQREQRLQREREAEARRKARTEQHKRKKEAQRLEDESKVRKRAKLKAKREKKQRRQARRKARRAEKREEMRKRHPYGRLRR